MTYERSEMARSAFQLKAVAGVTAGFGVALAAVVVGAAPRPAWPVSLIVAGGVLLIALGMWVYAVRPGMFNGRPGVFGDPLRTDYHRPAGPTQVAPPPTLARRFPVSEHVYAWQSVRRVAAGERVWTRAYVRMVVRQLALLVTAAVTLAVLGAGVALGLGALTDGTLCFVAAGVVLATLFGLSHRSGVIGVNDYATAPMPALPDLGWRPMAAEATPSAAAAERAAAAHTPPQRAA